MCLYWAWINIDLWRLPSPGKNASGASAIRLASAGATGGDAVRLRGRLRGAQPVRGAVGQAGRHQAKGLFPPVRGPHATAAVLVVDLPPRAERRCGRHATTIIHVNTRDVPASWGIIGKK